MVIMAASTAAYTLVIDFIVNQFNDFQDSDVIADDLKRLGYIILPILVIVPLVAGLSNFGQRIYSNILALNAVGDMQKQMFTATHRADFASFSQESTGHKISKFTHDVTVVSNALIRVLSNLVGAVLTIIFTIATMLYLNWRLSLALGIFLIAIWPVIAISQRMRGSAKDVHEHIGVITSDLKESFSGARMIKTYGLEDHETDRLGVQFDERIRRYMKLVSQKARVDPILEVLGGIVIAAVIMAGFYLINAGYSTVGSVVGVLAGAMILSPKLRALGTLNNVIQEGLSSLARIFDVIDERPKITDKPGAKILKNCKGHVTFSDVKFFYDDGTQALSKISLEAKPGEMIALVGESGGGKSTVINLIPRLYDVLAGAISIDGNDIRDLTLDSLRQNLALVSQDVTLFNDSVTANIRMGNLSASETEIESAAKTAAAYDFIMELPDGFATIIGEDGDTLSGGQKQRLAIARAILRDAPILLLDEATSALDADSEAKVQNALEVLGKGRTQIVIAHRLSTVKQADRIYVLEKGQVVETGTHASLSKKKNGVYARLRDLQMGD